MKRLICILLSAFLLIGAGISSANAAVPAIPRIDTSLSIDMPDFDIYEENGETVYAFNDTSGIRRTFFYLCTAQNPDGSVFTLLCSYQGAMGGPEVVEYYFFGKYALFCPEEYTPGYYFILADGEMTEFREAYKNGMFDSEALYQNLKDRGNIDGYWYKSYIKYVGDLNNDHTVDVIDAGIIQKYAVNKLKLTPTQRKFGDYNSDNKCDILDAAAIQKAAVDN